MYVCDYIDSWLSSIPSETCMSMVPLPAVLYAFFYCWISENECEATLQYHLWNNKDMHMIDLQHRALGDCFLGAVWLFSSSLDWGYTQYTFFVFLCATMISCEWQSRCIIGSKGCTVLCAVSCTKEHQFAECSDALVMPAFIYHAIPFSNIYLPCCVSSHLQYTPVCFF